MKKFLSKIDKNEKAAFMTTFSVGLLVHLFIYTNIIPNFDGISRVYDEQQMTVSGRWFLHYASFPHYFTQMPAVIGIISMFFLALTTVLILKILQIKSITASVLSAAIIVTFPAIAYTNTYTFTASAYSIAIFMAALSVWIFRKWKWGILPGGILLALAMGTYQVYAALAIALCLLCLFKELIFADKKVKDTIINGIRSAFFLLWGAIFYYITLQIFLKVKDVELLSYLGMDAVENGYPLSLLAHTLINTYLQVGKFFFFIEKSAHISQKIYVVMNWIIFFLGSTTFIIYIVKQKLWKQPVKAALGILILLFIPIAVNFGQIMSPYSEPALTMKFAYVCIYFLLLILAEECEKEVTQKSVEIMTSGIAILVLFSCIHYWKYDNVMYTMLAQTHRSSQTYASNLLERIENCKDYEHGMDVVIVGGFPKDFYYTNIDIYDMIAHNETLSNSVLPLNKHIYYYLNDWLNVPIEEPSEETFLQVSKSQDFKDMPLYPSDGSVKVIDGKVVVKIQKKYTPKEQYEIDYEKRK